MPDLVGQTIGRYRVVARLGRGGMAEVYKAYHPGLNRYIALKVLLSHLADDEDFIKRFEREARNVFNLRHQNIVRVFDFDSQQDVYYMAMEFVDGPSLKDELQERSEKGRPFTLEETARIMIALCEAVDFAHQQGMIHRDLKPSNFMLTRDGQILVLDFGIAKITDATKYTMTGMVTGTPAYMSPEQGQGERGDERSDIYSLGIVLYEMVTGRVPYDADTPFAVILKHINSALPIPKALNPDIPEVLEQVILKALSKEPGDRFQSGAEFAAAIREAVNLARDDNLARNPVTPLVSPPDVTELSPSDPTFKASTDTPALTMESGGAVPTVVSDKKSPNRRFAVIGGLIAGFVIIAAVVGIFISNANRSQAAAAATSTLAAQLQLTAEYQALQTGTAQALAQISADTPTPILTSTPTPLPTDTPNTEATVNALLDARATQAAAATSEVAATLTASAPTATDTPLPTDTPVPTNTPPPTNTPAPTDTPIPRLPTRAPPPPPPSPPEPKPAAPAISGRLAVPVDNGQGGFTINIYAIPDGRQVGKLENARQPDFRADGLKMLVNGEGGGRDNIWEVNTSNWQFEKAVSSSPSDFHPYYSPDGARLVVGNANLAVGADGNTHPFLFVQCAVRNPQEEPDVTCREVARFGVLVPNGQIGEIHGSNPVWTGNDLIVYKGCNTWEGGNSCGLFRVGSWANKRSSNGMTPSKLAGIDGTDTIPTDTYGTNILYHDRKDNNWEVYIATTDGGPRNLSNDPTANDALGAFSPDGQWVAFVSDRGGGWAIWSVPTAGGVPTKLFDIPWGAPLRDWLNERISWGP